MKSHLKALVVGALITPAASFAAIIQFDLIGTAGAGLLPGNEPSMPVPSFGSGGEIGAGIFYDDVTNIITVNVGWGSGNGFENLTSAANNSHIHGPTASSGGAGFTETAGVLANLARSNSSSNFGAITGQTVTLSDANETNLFDGRLYINVHTLSNAGGEIRGFLVPAAIPEPSTFAALAGAAVLGLAALRRRRA